MFTFSLLFYMFALVIFEVGSTFADSSPTVIDEVIPQMMAGRGHKESIFHGTWIVIFVLSKVKRCPEKLHITLLSCWATDFAAGTTWHNHPMLTGLSEVEKHVSTVVESRWGGWKHDPYGRWCPRFQRSPGRQGAMLVYFAYISLLGLWCVCIFVCACVYLYINK